MNLLPKIFPQNDDQRRAKDERDLIRMEAQIGGLLFGPLPNGHNRQFFCLDERTWIWHEEWDENGQHQVLTTRYNVRPSGVLKSQGNGGYQPISYQEARNLWQTIKLYDQRVRGEYQRMLQTA